MTAPKPKPTADDFARVVTVTRAVSGGRLVAPEDALGAWLVVPLSDATVLLAEQREALLGEFANLAAELMQDRYRKAEGRSYGEGYADAELHVYERITAILTKLRGTP